MNGLPTIFLLAAALNLLAEFGTVGVFVYTQFIFKKPPIKNQVEAEELKKKSAQEAIEFKFFKLDRITTNLAFSSSVSSSSSGSDNSSKSNAAEVVSNGRKVASVPAITSARLRYLDMQMNFQLFNDKLEEELVQKKAIIYDKIIQIASTYSADEINSITGKMFFEEKVRTAIREIVGRPVIKSIYFTTFTVK